MKYKLLAIDMDGTLLNSNNEVSSRTRLALEKAKSKGVYVVLSTGRILKSAISYARILELKNPIIACNGAVVVDENEKIIHKRPIEMELVEKIAKIAMERKIYYHFYDETKFYSYIKVDEILKFYSEGNGYFNIDIHIFDSISELKDKNTNIYKFLFVDNDKNKLNSFRKELESLGNVSISSSWNNNLEAMGLNVSKGTALEELCKKLNIDPKEVIAIGDSENDISMIRFAGLGVAMGNGNDDVKKNADYITDTNDNDGVAKVIEKFILE